MLTAKLGNNMINCYDGKYSRETLKQWDKKKILLCPACNKPYEYCHGRVQTPYFRHKDKEQCIHLYSEPETEEHTKGKIALFEWVKTLDNVFDVVLEGWIPETRQRPDIMFKCGDKQYVIEYQCSPIASEYIERHELYQASGVCDIWICGTNNYLEKSEIGKKFRKKELEKQSKYYFDPEYEIFIFKEYRPTQYKDGYLGINDKEYFYKDKREKLLCRKYEYTVLMNDYSFSNHYASYNARIYKQRLCFTRFANMYFSDEIRFY